MKQTNKRKFGDRKDAKLVRKHDPLHIVMPYMYPDRCDNEAYINVDVDITKLKELLDEKNIDKEKGKKYTYFHCVLVSLLKTIVLRPEMNRFVQNYRLYEKNTIDFSFVVRRQFIDGSKEGLAYLTFDKDSCLEDVYEKVIKEVFVMKKGKEGGAEGSLKLFTSFPRFLSAFIIRTVNFLDKKGIEPNSLASTDMSYSSVFISNIGSLGLSSGYHHLSNRGTNSIFAMLGEASYKPIFNKDGTYEMRLILPIGFTVDERINDGFYCAKSIAIFKKILENPEYLMNKGVEDINE